ncbi:MAG: hypothetical protein HXY44_13985 [Syntrophaceae bacterium]|nr:hypothetical protein [Syntrophaceae bacterium]
MPEKTILANYIVRIYRFQKNKPTNLVGVVEEVGQKGKKAFISLNELWEILSSSKEMRNQKRGKKRGKTFHKS